MANDAALAGREQGTLLDAPHGPITISVEALSKHSLEVYWSHPTERGGIGVQYRGHKDDLAAAGCLKFGLERYDRFLDDGCGGFWWVTGKAGPGKRGFIAVNYYACNAGFAASLPGVRERSQQILSHLGTRPHLRLVVDNTRA
jgi:hypothetical protein